MKEIKVFFRETVRLYVTCGKSLIIIIMLLALVSKSTVPHGSTKVFP